MQEINSVNDELGAKLEIAGNDIVAQIHYCSEQVTVWEQRKQFLQNQLNETFQRLQKEFNVPKQKLNKNTVSKLIHSFLKNGPARTADIRKFLLSQGKNTNPGVALGRMVKDKAIEHIERGVYQLS